jgi:hypothetical protein
LGYQLWQQATHEASSEAGSSGLVVEYFDTVLRPDEAPQGVGRLSEAEALRRPHAFKLYRRGDQVERVDVLGGQGRLLRHNPFHLLASGGVPTTTPLREASYHFVRDEEGRVTEVTAQDDTGRVLWGLSHSTPSRVRFSERAGPWGKALTAAALFELVRDNSGAVREVWYVDMEGRRTPARGGAHGLRVSAADTGEVRFTLLDASGKPTGTIACWVFLSSNEARRVEEAYFDVAGKPVAGAEGCPRWVWSQEGPQELRGAGFDAERRPMRTSDGNHSCLRRFDGQSGKCLAAAYFGLDGKPCLHKEGYHRWIASYDERGNQVEGALFGPDGEPYLYKDGYHRWTISYDEEGKCLAAAYFGLDGKPCRHKLGCHRLTKRYDKRGNQVEGPTSGRRAGRRLAMMRAPTRAAPS